jgi:CRISPR/Cas system CSM-associated protein Csm3 (group 7 of RAMP superfamily)
MTSPDRFRTFRATIEIPLTVTAEGPLLIKGPSAALPDRPDDAFVRYPTLEFGPLPYLPGSSLKGVLRSGSEALLRALGRPCCDPLEQHGKVEERCARQTGAWGRPGLWADRCAACFAYGSVKGAGVCVVEDGLPWRPGDPMSVRAERAAEIEQRSTVRTSVAINRQTGAADSKKLFDYEVLVGVTFHPTIRLRNPRPWEAALVAAAIGLLDEGTLRIGSGTTRGLGRVHATPDAVVVSSLQTDGLRDLLEAGQFGPSERTALLEVRRAQDPAATLRAWSARLGAWLPEAAMVGECR